MIQAVGENNTCFVLMMGRKESCHQQCLQWNTWLHISPLNIVIPIWQNAHEEKILESAAGGLIQDAEKAEDVPVETPETA